MDNLSIWNGQLSKYTGDESEVTIPEGVKKSAKVHSQAAAD